MPWVKIYTEILDDVKLSKLTDDQKWRFVQLILLAATCDAAGAFVIGESLMTHSDMSWRLRIDIEILEKDIKKMLQVGLLEMVDGMLCVTKFAERQGPTQAEKREQWRNLQNARRDRIKSSNVINESLMTHTGVINIEEDIDQDSSRKKIKHPERQELITYFLAQTGLPAPREADIRTMQKLWWSPMDEILKWNGGEIVIAKEIINQSVDQLKKKRLTISDPNSIIKTARSVYAIRRNPPKDEVFAAEW